MKKCELSIPETTRIALGVADALISAANPQA